jgi:hypothetical protein
MSVRRRVLPLLLASLAALLLMIAPAHAQLQVAAIRGIVLDASDLVIPGVTRREPEDPVSAGRRLSLSRVRPGA